MPKALSCYPKIGTGGERKLHSEKKHTHWKNIKGMAEMEAVGMMAELQQIQRNRMITFIPQIAFLRLWP